MSAQADALASLGVLVVDDEADVRELLVEYFRTKQFDVSSAADFDRSRHAPPALTTAARARALAGIVAAMIIGKPEPIRPIRHTQPAVAGPSDLCSFRPRSTASASSSAASTFASIMSRSSIGAR